MMDISFSQDNQWSYIMGISLFFVFFAALVLIFNFVIKKLQIKAEQTATPWDDFIIKLIKFPAIWIIFSISVHTFSIFFEKNNHFFEITQKISQILLVLAIGWLVIQVTRFIFEYLRNKFDLSDVNDTNVRKKLTQLKILENISIAIIIIVFMSIALMSIDSLHDIGMSMLTSAGVVGIIVGLAAQRSVGQILSGIQIAFTQPVKIGDVVVVEGEWGRIEEINITYVVVRIWDERYLILPIDYFIQKPIENWTRHSAKIMGTIYLYVSYELPLDPLREHLKTLLKDNPNWDGRVQSIIVTGSKEWYKEIRILVSSEDSSKNWDLRVELREKMIDYINEKHPGSFAKINLPK